ncbi:flagellar motor stator protein MotA [Tumebacillus permanentifrigoris]|uniref:Chemotaxis protein MotA n=1 Tax=Tumebacillus permanentifrigoris TaxID=378543 RepID=A0A316DGS2_9BACL|nr:flagellar motor stator protein MotA [Tumebacillus permanentifrigoris]PWK16439.1 chemotaxis protein MotA [Tumebacillus permanentifrigoris]
MELSTLIGLGLALVSILGGMFLKGASPAALLNPAALLIILGGTTAAVCLAFPMKELKKVPKLLRLIFKGQDMQDKKATIIILTKWAMLARREGILTLEGEIETVDDRFLKKGMGMVVDGIQAEDIQAMLEDDIAAMKERHAVGALIFSQAGTYSPTLGVLGAVIGLVAALGNMSDIEKLGHSISAAFIATLFGIFFGYVIFHPFANKLKRRTKREAEMKTMILEGILSIQSGQNPKFLTEKLAIYLEEQDRNGLEETPEAGV